MRSNVYDKEANVFVIATPYYPSVVAALNKTSQRKNHLTEEEFRSHSDKFFQSLGLYVDWQKDSYVDSRGNYVQNTEQMDSLMFLVSLINRTWPCAVPIIDNVPIATNTDWPCFTPSLSNLEKTIYLENEKGQVLYPKFIWGKRNNSLTNEESIYVMFSLRGRGEHFFHGSNSYFLRFKELAGC